MKKSLRLHVSPKKYQWFEVGTEDEIQILPGDEADAAKKFFDQIKDETFRDALSVLKDINCPLNDEKLREFEQLLNAKTNPVLQDNVVRVNTAPANVEIVEEMNESQDEAMDVANILDGYINNFPEFSSDAKQ